MRILLYALLTGAASAFAFEPVGVWLLMPVAFAVLLWLLSQAQTLRRALLVGWIFGVGQFVVGLNWIATAFGFQAAMPAWLGWIAVVLLSLYLAVYPALAAGLAWRIGKDNEIARSFALAGGWAITEWLRAGIFTGFAWNPVGAALVPTPLLGTTALIGTYGLSALTVLLGAVIWLEIKRKFLPGVAIAFATALLWLLPSSPVPETPLLLKPIRVVQPNIGQEQKWRPEFAEEAARKLAQLSQTPGGEHPHLLLWPEAAVTQPLQDDRAGPASAFAAFERSRAAQSLQNGEALLTGGISLQSADGQNVSGATNSVFVIAPGGRALARYDKAHLVPYGEYLPMRALLTPLGLSRLVPGDTDFSAGPGPRSVELPNWGKIGIQVCYEIIFSGHVADKANRPDFIFNPSNDAWFGRWGPPQHLAQARLRAAEEGLPVVRATPTGISAVIDGRGHVVQQIGWRQAGVIDTNLPPPSPQPTLFGRFGNVVPLLLSALLLLGAIALAGSRRYRHT
ncbi:apolipoprotein N-acyltransferase [Sphingomonas sabuli]|uniref:Apolipoprotein N-acyltransferase n=1 Tax=Sphingomonas sabuli TaxID=2764186 RepID=A0A7G9L564_9SPHN|nr:apolipoprotein N-acyltransferase [Sphingomonas sabuli]QNM83763.1 apolipoprotein N-acyltransferase [Sphingomonas sabuli]